MSALPPEFQTWLDYALATMDEHREKSVRTADQNGALTYADIQTAALAELDHLRRKAAMPWVGLLEVWQMELSKKLGRSAEDIVANNLQATDFSDESILIQYEDGTNLKFQRAFFTLERRQMTGEYIVLQCLQSTVATMNFGSDPVVA